jgi:hypothetical protein
MIILRWVYAVFSIAHQFRASMILRKRPVKDVSAVEWGPEHTRVEYLDQSEDCLDSRAPEIVRGPEQLPSTPANSSRSSRDVFLDCEKLPSHSGHPFFSEAHIRETAICLWLRGSLDEDNEFEVVPFRKAGVSL